MAPLRFAAIITALCKPRPCRGCKIPLACIGDNCREDIHSVTVFIQINGENHFAFCSVHPKPHNGTALLSRRGNTLYTTLCVRRCSHKRRARQLDGDCDERPTRPQITSVQREPTQTARWATDPCYVTDEPLSRPLFLLRFDIFISPGHS